MTQNQGLRQRANGGATRPPSTDVADVQRDRGQSVAALIDAQRGALQRALPKHLDADRLARIVLTVCKQTPALLEADAASLLGAVMSCAQLGLEPGPLGEAYFLPFRNNREHKMLVTFVVGYKGMVKLAYQSEQLADLVARSVHEGDLFDYEYGTKPFIKHKPAAAMDRSGATGVGDLTHVYAIATLKSGGSVFTVLNRTEVESFRSRSRAKDNGPWVTDYDAMARKTAMRQLDRWLPKSPDLRMMHLASALDETVRTDYTSTLDEAAVRHVPGDGTPAAPLEPSEVLGEGNDQRPARAGAQSPPNTPAVRPKVAELAGWLTKCGLGEDDPGRRAAWCAGAADMDKLASVADLTDAQCDRLVALLRAVDAGTTDLDTTAGPGWQL